MTPSHAEDFDDDYGISQKPHDFKDQDSISSLIAAALSRILGKLSTVARASCGFERATRASERRARDNISSQWMWGTFTFFNGGGCGCVNSLHPPRFPEGA